MLTYEGRKVKRFGKIKLATLAPDGTEIFKEYILDVKSMNTSIAESIMPVLISSQIRIFDKKETLEKFANEIQKEKTKTKREELIEKRTMDYMGILRPILETGSQELRPFYGDIIRECCNIYLCSEGDLAETMVSDPKKEEIIENELGFELQESIVMAVMEVTDVNFFMKNFTGPLTIALQKAGVLAKVEEPEKVKTKQSSSSKD